jgi:outer membrane protein W
MTIIRRLSFAVALILTAGSVSAFAQSDRETSLLLGGGAMNYDLSGTGTTPAFTARVSHGLGANFVLEGGVLVAKPDQQFGPSTLIAPEAQLQYHFRAGRFTPYLGAGLGFIRESADVIETDWTQTVSFAGGSRVSLNERVGLFGELRIRGVEWDFTGTTTDIVGGVVVRLGR